MMIVIAAMVGSAFLMTLVHAADIEQQKSKPQMEQKQADKAKRRRCRAVQWAKNARADRVPVERAGVET